MARTRARRQKKENARRLVYHRGLTSGTLLVSTKPEETSTAETSVDGATEPKESRRKRSRRDRYTRPRVVLVADIRNNRVRHDGVSVKSVTDFFSVKDNTVPPPQEVAKPYKRLIKVSRDSSHELPKKQDLPEQSIEEVSELSIEAAWMAASS